MVLSWVFDDASIKSETSHLAPLSPSSLNSADAPSSSLQYLLSDKEIKVKTALWMAENSDYLKEQKGTFSEYNMFLCWLCFKTEFNFYFPAGSSQTEPSAVSILTVKPPTEPSVSY